MPELRTLKDTRMIASGGSLRMTLDPYVKNKYNLMHDSFFPAVLDEDKNQIIITLKPDEEFLSTPVHIREVREVILHSKKTEISKVSLIKMWRPGNYNNPKYQNLCQDAVIELVKRGLIIDEGTYIKKVEGTYIKKVEEVEDRDSV